jgi:hypothetical protein
VVLTESLKASSPATTGVAAHAEQAWQEADSHEPTPLEGSAPFARHVHNRTVVLPELRVLFLPIPKAGCTSLLWLLAELAGIPAETFSQSGLLEVSPGLAIHDMNLWAKEHRLAGYRREARERILSDDDWFRFTVVRHPGTRLWSAWQSKLLLREPRFVATFGDQPWFPRVPGEPADLVEDFRRFVAALGSEGAEDVHWAVQHDLAEQLPLTHVGRVERLHETLALLREHLPADTWPGETSRQNRALVPMPPALYDDAAGTVLQERYRADFEQYGYEGTGSQNDTAGADWEQQVAPSIPVIRDIIDRHTRIGELYRAAQQRFEKKFETVSAQQGGRSKAPVLTNIEGHTDFNVRWAWAEARPQPGFTAVVRVKNEATSLPWVLPPLLRAVQQVVLIDNESTDGTADVARRVAEEVGAAERLAVHHYPFSVARCGEEHLDTPAASVHSLAYFYNWSFSHVRTAYALKWDGDMVLTDAAVTSFRDLAWQLEAADVVVKVPRYGLYVAGDQRAFLDIGMRNCEPWAWPNQPGYRFVKAMEWELPLWGSQVTTITLPDWACLELKYLDADEFDHWSDSEFDTSARTQRKRREWQVFHALANGGEPPPDVLAIEAPNGQHIIDYVRSTLLPAKASERSESGDGILRPLTRITA